MGSNPTKVKFSLTRGDHPISFKGVITQGDWVYWQYCLLPAPKSYIFLYLHFLHYGCYAVPILYITTIWIHTATHYLNYPDLLPYWPRSSVGRASEDLIQRSWVQTPPRGHPISFKGVITQGDWVYRRYCLLPAPKTYYNIYISYITSARRFSYYIDFSVFRYRPQMPAGLKGLPWVYFLIYSLRLFKFNTKGQTKKEKLSQNSC